MLDLQNLHKYVKEQQYDYKQCLYPCDITEYDYRVTTKIAPTISDNSRIGFTFEYITRHAMIFADEPQQSLSEYIA
jgi:hypothetical protein